MTFTRDTAPATGTPTADARPVKPGKAGAFSPSDFDPIDFDTGAEVQFAAEEGPGATTILAGD